MTTLLVVLVIILLLGGGGFGAYSFRSSGPGYSIGSLVVTLLVIWLVLHYLFRVV